jgi:hypothetical protein
MKRKNVSKTRKNNKKHPSRRVRGGAGCACACGDPKQIKGGTTDFQSNGLPENIASFGNSGNFSNMDPRSMMVSGRFLNGGRRRTKKQTKGRGRGRGRSLGKLKIGGAWYDFNPLAGNQDNIMSAFGNASGAALNAKLASGIELHGKNDSIFTNGSIKPMV